jgi:RES domain-containing protein
VVYTASTASLAALELLVHLTRRAKLHERVIFACTFDEGIVEIVKRRMLPGNWQAVPPPRALPDIGDSWVSRASSAVLQVPSVIIETESNYILNPAHADFAKITIAAPTPFSLDLRLLRR